MGLEHCGTNILELVTPTTAELLAWWCGDEFGDDRVAARGGRTGWPHGVAARGGHSGG